MKRIVIATAILLLVSTSAFAQSEIPAPKADSSFGKTQLFQIIILTGSTEGPEELKNLPKNSEKAIRDIRDFLPYKRYVLVDSGLLRMTSHAGPSQTTLTGKIGGSTVEFETGMRYREQEGKLSVERFQLIRMDPKPRAVLETSFGIARGETVVVGTSKLNGDGGALIVLVTAVPTS